MVPYHACFEGNKASENYEAKKERLGEPSCKLEAAPGVVYCFFTDVLQHKGKKSLPLVTIQVHKTDGEMDTGDPYDMG